jgi:hypothetical protein
VSSTVLTLDAAGVASLLAVLTARAEFGQFVFTVTTTNVFQHRDHPFVRMRTRGIGPWAYIGWNAVYRSPTFKVPIIGNVAGVGAAVVGQDIYPGFSRRFGQQLDPYSHNWVQDPAECVACDRSDSVLAQALLLTWAQACFDAHDLRSKGGRPPAKFP